MANKLSADLAKQFPEMGVAAGACGGGVWCKKDGKNRPCIQIRDGYISGNQREVTGLPLIPNASGCGGCERNQG